MKAAACLAMTLGAQCVAAADAPPSFEHPERWGSPWLLSEPEYPKDALEENVTGFVDVEARVAGTGELKEVEIRAGSPEAARFVAPVRAALELWRFYAPLGDDCLPSAERVTTRVSFEIDHGTPRIFVTRSQRPIPRAADLKPVSRTNISYPRDMIRNGREAILFARSEVDPEGNVVAVSATAFPRELAQNLFSFEKATRGALREWKFPPAPPGTTALRFFCSDVVFRLRD